MSLVHEPLEREQLDVEQVIREVNDAADRVAKASTELAELTKRFEGAVNESGEVSYGVKILYEIAIADELLKIVDEAAENDKRPPAEDIRLARARRHVRINDEELYVAYVQAEMKLTGLRSYIAAQKQVISGKQSVLNGLKALGA